MILLWLAAFVIGLVAAAVSQRVFGFATPAKLGTATLWALWGAALTAAVWTTHA